MDVSRVDTPWRRGQSVERRHAVTRVASPVLQGGPGRPGRPSVTTGHAHPPRHSTQPHHGQQQQPHRAAPHRAVTRHTHTRARAMLDSLLLTGRTYSARTLDTPEALCVRRVRLAQCPHQPRCRRASLSFSHRQLCPALPADNT